MWSHSKESWIQGITDLTQKSGDRVSYTDWLKYSSRFMELFGSIYQGDFIFEGHTIEYHKIFDCSEGLRRQRNDFGRSNIDSGAMYEVLEDSVSEEVFLEKDIISTSLNLLTKEKSSPSASSTFEKKTPKEMRFKVHYFEEDLLDKLQKEFFPRSLRERMKFKVRNF
jgi:hypothetical protein